MLSEIVTAALAGAPHMRIVTGAPSIAELGKYTRQRHIDAVIFGSGNQDFRDETIVGVLHANPRLCLLAVDGREDRVVVHCMAPSRDVFPHLEVATLTAAIRAGTRLRLG